MPVIGVVNLPLWGCSLALVSIPKFSYGSYVGLYIRSIEAPSRELLGILNQGVLMVGHNSQCRATPGAGAVIARVVRLFVAGRLLVVGSTRRHVSGAIAPLAPHHAPPLLSSSLRTERSCRQAGALLLRHLLGLWPGVAVCVQMGGVGVLAMHRLVACYLHSLPHLQRI
jgi:hypothetical protein